MNRLEGKRIVLTGGAGGIGLPLAQLLDDLGAHVTNVDRLRCPAAHVNWLTDLGDDIALTQLARTLAAETPDMLINLAGVLAFGLHEKQDPAQLALCYRINLLVPAVLAQAVAGPMRARGSGQIVNVGSVLGAIPYPWFAAYSSSKAGLAALSQALRRELDGSGVTVTHIAPRAARTAFNNSLVNRFLTVAGMTADSPDHVAARIAEAIRSGAAHVTVGRMEGLFSLINAIAPRMIDRGIAPQLRRLRAEFS
ncbi:SDR family NAD(P)-dependent oxidoreductase [Novosphingobium rosa]|uniref:SDR family NAD(P)-dependent oxidoreductase n=1 Tax=Novosphingobium rosa TaxID=76978 RepID=UPI0008339B1D|nr:SDR family NAD(P)-dependent oxidoreductase [Novosphingobium rosa]